MAEKVCAESDIAVDSPMRAVVDGTAIAIVKDSAGTVHAIGDTCTHGDISLSEGWRVCTSKIDDGCVVVSRGSAASRGEITL